MSTTPMPTFSKPAGSGKWPTPLQPGIGNVEDGRQLRADAVRNRALLLEAATQLVAEHGVAGLTMDAVAAAARVGKGTVYRRFGDRVGLLTALLDHSEKRFQVALLGGPPPLGPGAPPVERLGAFGCAQLRRLSEELEVQLAAEPSAEHRHTAAPRRFLRGHVAMLLRQAVPDADSELLSHTLMSSFDIALVHHLTQQRGMPLTRLEAAWLDLVARVTGTKPPEGCAA
ncbi:TetR/AcrR family transcriptional regulator [Streptomyces sp. NPDC002740]